jgi:hypothetical protein
MKRIHVDFNTLNSEPVDLVKLAAPGTLQEEELPAIEPGERVMLYDSDGLEVEAVLIRDSEGWWMAAPDAATWRDTAPEQSLLPPMEAMS